MNIKKRGLHQTIKDVVISNTKMTEEQLLNDTTDYTLKKTNDFFRIVKKHDDITICGDYDDDGITATSIMYKLLKSLGKKVNTRLPKRFSEGFGLSTAAIEEIDTGLIVTVDNGISASNVIEMAKNKGLSVIVTDHHLADGELPSADLIIDPMAFPKSATFSAYCGAGIAYKLACASMDEEALKELSVLACIGTVADSVPLIGDNRKIVKDGLKNIRDGHSPIGIKALMDALGIDQNKMVVDDIAYKIGPALNAPGRLFDDGASKSLELVLCENKEEAVILANEIADLNKKRQNLMSDAMQEVDSIIENQALQFTCPIIVEHDIHEGLIGIIAGKVSEKYQVPTIILTKADKGLKGSSRAPIGFNIKKDLDSLANDNPEFFVNYGGHERAAGLTINENCLENFKEAYKNLYPNYKPNSRTVEYDLKASMSEIPDILDEMDKYGPFGEGNPAPIIYIDKFETVPDKQGSLYRLMGEGNKSIKLLGPNYFSAVAFDAADYFFSLGSPTTVEMVGTLAHNYWNGWEFSQMTIIDFDKISQKEISLEDFIRERISQMTKVADMNQ